MGQREPETLGGQQRRLCDAVPVGLAGVERRDEPGCARRAGTGDDAARAVAGRLGE